jgi:glutamine synthetase
MEIEVKCLNNICLNQVIPAAAAYQKTLAKAVIATKEVLGTAAVVPAQTEILKKIVDLVNNVYSVNKDIMVKVEAANAVHDEAKKADALCSKIKPKMDELREYVDELENLVDDELWPLPKFWEMLFIS